MTIVVVHRKVGEATCLLEFLARRNQEGIDDLIESRIVGIDAFPKPVGLLAVSRESRNNIPAQDDG